MSWRTLVSTLVLVSFSAVAAGQAPPARPKTSPKKRPAASKPVPAAIAPPPAPAPALPPPTDVLVRTRYITGAQVSENTTYIQGPRQRFEFPGITMIAQCDLKRSLQLHDGSKQYMVVSTVKASSGGGFGVGSALRVAAFAGQMYLTMGMGSGMMGMMGPGAALGGIGGGVLSGRMNPGMGAAMSIMSAGSSMGMAGAMPGMAGSMPGMPDMSDEKVTETVQDGLSKAVKQVADELKKPAAREKK